jgi:hypothetical protein
MEIPVPIFRAAVVASGLRLYAAAGIKPNRAYTPSRMMEVAEAITGKTFKRRAYIEAADALDAWRAERGYVKSTAA